MSSDPIPYKSDRIFNVSLNIWPLDNPGAELIEVMRYNDAMHILKKMTSQLILWCIINQKFTPEILMLKV